MMRDWSSLKIDVLCTIVEEKLDLEDYLRCQSVCKSWKSAIKSSPMCLRCPQLPWLMLPYCQNHTTSTSTGTCRRFYCLYEGKTHHIQFPPGYDDKRCVGSSHGWLVIMEETTHFLFLLNPLTKQRIELPPISSFPDILHFDHKQLGREYFVAYGGGEYHFSMEEMSEFYLAKVILSSDPTLPGCVAVAIYGGKSRLAYCRIGDPKWSEMHPDFIFQEEVIFWKGAFYAAGHTGSLLVFDPNTKKVEVIIERDNAKQISGTRSGRYYLVADSVLDELLLICKEITWPDEDRGRSRASKIHAYTLNEEKKCWEKKQSLGGKVLFLGFNYTLCFSAADYPQLKPNTIYFTDDYFEGYIKGIYGGHDVGFFDMDGGFFKPLPCCDPQASIIWPPPVWVTPSLTATSSSPS